MIRVRFAANPAGPLFIAGARVALANYLYAYRNDGTFLLRFDDLDRNPSQPRHAEQIMQDLRWLGIEWESSFYQSEQPERYLDAISRLKHTGRLYPCFESEHELRAKEEYRRRHHQPVIYDGAMLALTKQQREAAEAGGKRPYWRWQLSDRTLTWQDLILGPRRAALSDVSDPILVRADGTPTPILASVADDIAYETTHIIRGDDSPANTAIQIELFEALTATQAMVRFGHLPALDPPTPMPGRRTAIPHAAGAPERRVARVSVRALRNDGVEPCTLVASLTGITSDDGNPLPVEDLAQSLALTDFATVDFDVARLLEINRRVLRHMDFASVSDRLPAGATEAFWLAVRGSVDLIREAWGWWDVVGGTIVPPVIEGERDLLATAAALLPPEPWDRLVWAHWIAALERTTGRSDHALVAPLRLALTGESSGPDLADLLPLIGRIRAISRLRTAAQ